MNREQAKIIGQLSDETLKALSREDLTGKRDVLGAIAEGREVEFICPISCKAKPVDERLSYTRRCYRIATPKITFNGVEIDAPIKYGESKDDSPISVVRIDCDGHASVCESTLFAVNQVSGIPFAKPDQARLYRDTHNKMMGVGDD